MGLRMLGSTVAKGGELHVKDSMLKEEEGDAGKMATRLVSFNTLVELVSVFPNLPSFYWLQPYEDTIPSMKQRFYNYLFIINYLIPNVISKLYLPVSYRVCISYVCSEMTVVVLMTCY